MFKDTFLIAWKTKDLSPGILSLEILILFILKVFIRLILEVFVHQLQNDSLSTQAFNHTNATIIRI
jgi:hypothetical protein